MFKFFSDPALTTEIESLSVSTMLDGSTATPVPTVVYFGNDESGSVTKEGGGQITVYPVDSDSGSGVAASSVRLALTEAGLSSATGGAALEIGSSIASGSANAVAVWVSVSANIAPGIYTDISLATSTLIEA